MAIDYDIAHYLKEIDQRVKTLDMLDTKILEDFKDIENALRDLHVGIRFSTPLPDGRTLAWTKSKHHDWGLYIGGKHWGSLDRDTRALAANYVLQLLTAGIKHLEKSIEQRQDALDTTSAFIRALQKHVQKRDSHGVPTKDNAG